jgi:endo-1,4-beta-D-glucanase Y
MLKKVSLCFVLCLSFVYSQTTVNYPYPQRKTYGNGTISVKNSTADADLKAKFITYMTNFYEEGNCNGGARDCARIKFDTPTQTVSEGIGYGMLMAVYFSDKTKSYQSEFDKLWAYYKKFSNDGIMDWKITGFSSPAGTGGATDAEYDVALALIMAHYQFGDAKYKTDAETLIGKIWSKEHNTSTGLHKPGSNWDSDKNPSYVAPAAYQLFKDWGNSANWDLALSANYTFLKNNQNSTSGLPSNWANADGSVKECSSCGYSSQNYGQDAVRAPWRWAKARAWFNHADAKTLLDKLAAWVNGKSASDIKGPISLNGATMGSDANSSYLGSLMNALMVSSIYQSKLNSFWSSLMTNTSGESYYNQSMLILTGLLASGNMPNLKACASNSCGTTMTQVGEGGDGTQIDKLSVADSESEEDRGFAATWEAWYAYTDEKAGYNEKGEPENGQAKSKITNEKFPSLDENANCKEIESYRVVQKDGNDWVVKINSYTLDQGTYAYDPFVAIGLNARNNGTAYDLSSCEAFKYDYKGEAHKFKVQTTAIKEGSGEDHLKVISTASNNSWTTATVPIDELAQPSWVPAASVKPFEASKIYAFAWELVGDVESKGVVTTGVSAMTGSLAIKNFSCIGSVTLPDEKPVPKCGTPIIAPKFAHGGNALSAMPNAFNLQASSNAVIQIFDLKGNMVRKISFAQGNHTVQMTDLPKGLYIVRAKFGSESKVLRVPVK